MEYDYCCEEGGGTSRLTIEGVERLLWREIEPNWWDLRGPPHCLLSRTSGSATLPHQTHPSGGWVGTTVQHGSGGSGIIRNIVLSNHEILVSKYRFLVEETPIHHLKSTAFVAMLSGASGELCSANLPLKCTATNL